MCQRLSGMSEKTHWQPEFAFQLHCVALGKWLSHSVPQFPCVYKTNPNDCVLSTYCVPSAFTRGFSLSQP